MTRRVTRRADDLGQELLRTSIAMQDIAFSTFFVIQHELHGNAGPARPVRMRRLSPVSDQVSGVVFIIGHGLTSGLTGQKKSGKIGLWVFRFVLNPVLDMEQVLIH